MKQLMKKTIEKLDTTGNDFTSFGNLPNQVILTTYLVGLPSQFEKALVTKELAPEALKQQLES